MEPVTAFILAGGKSTRMGRDKAFLKLDGRPLITHALTKAKAITTNVKIVGDPQKFSQFGEAVSDVYSGRGPLAGIHAALVNTSTDWNLILGVDLPFLSANFLEYLIHEAQLSQAAVTVPSAGGYLQTLSAVYRKEFRVSAERALSKRENKIDALFAQVHTHIIDEKELNAAGFDAAMFRNLNTLEEWSRAEHEFQHEQR